VEQSVAGRRWNLVLLFAAGIAMLAIIGFGLASLSGGGGGSKPKPPKISLIPNTPPPPPPKEEKKPEPPKEQKEVKMEQPQLKDAPPPDQTLKMEGPTGNSPSGIQAGTVTNENLANIGGGGGGSAFAFYTNFMQKFLQDELARNKALAGRDYRVSVMLWLDRSGKLERFNLTQSSGNPQTDALIRSALAEMPPFKAPPENMPRPVGVRIGTRG
jgi:protein TonB